MTPRNSKDATLQWIEYTFNLRLGRDFWYFAEMPTPEGFVRYRLIYQCYGLTKEGFFTTPIEEVSYVDLKIFFEK